MNPRKIHPTTISHGELPPELQQAATALRRNEVRDAIRKGVHDALHAEAWASCEERCGRSHGGQQIDQICGEPTKEACMEGDRIVAWYGRHLGLDPAEVELQRGLDVLADAYEANVKLPDHRRKPDPHSFGWCLAMQALGTGVAWSDDHPDANLPGRTSTYFSYDHPSEYGATLPLEYACDVLFGDSVKLREVLTVRVDTGTQPAVLHVFARLQAESNMVAVLGHKGVAIDSFYGDHVPRAVLVKLLREALEDPAKLVHAILQRMDPKFGTPVIGVSMLNRDFDTDPGDNPHHGHGPEEDDDDADE